tara:strand:- start:461 stop:1054 length:594 start_codon:yes stop_codon:yes gene_type:complete
MSTKKLSVIEKIKLPIPKQINLDMINYLGNNALWNFVFDWDRNDVPNFLNIIDSSETTDNGFATITYSIDKSIAGTREDSVMNNFGNWVYHFCRENSKKYKIKRLQRLYWNLYSQTSKCEWHTDIQLSEQNKYSNTHASIIYNFHDNDGGTEIEGQGLLPAKEREAIIFPSNVLHKGVGPTQNKWRLSLNIIVQLET